MGEKINSTVANETGKHTLFHPTASLTNYNNQLISLVRSRKSSPESVLKKVLNIVGEMNSQKLRYDLNTYNALLAAYARAKDQTNVTETLRKMEEEGVSPTTDSYNLIMEAFGNDKNIALQNRLKEEMQQKGLELNSVTYYHLLRGQQNNIELALETLEDMKKRGIEPTLLTYSLLIRSCRAKTSNTAFNLLKEAEEKGLPVQNEPRMYFDVLRLGTRRDEYEMVNHCWNKAITEHSLRPDEGTCLHVLRVAAKKGDTKLATDVIRQLSTNGYPYKEHYFTPLMEAFLVKDDLKSAFNVLDIMRVSGVPPTMNAIYALREKLSKDIKTIDKAYYILEELRREKKAVDVTAFNVVVAACADAGDLERTISTHREAENLGVKPDVDTYNAILDVCIKARVDKMDKVVIEEMKKANISPNIDTYIKMIELSCNRANYEEAFSYLETMKEYGILPPERCYALLARKLSYNKDPRFHLVLEEMETFGYKRKGYYMNQLAPDPSLSTFMDALTQVEDIFNLLNHTDTDNNQVYTVFCPVNSAFKKELDLYTRSHLGAFLRNHIVPNVKLDPNSLNKAHSLDTLLPGQSISVRYHFLSKRTVLNKNANVDINHSVEAINGIAYKIDHLLRPT
ncbi:hypothetical protein G6F57_008494 [Rhizopus arrhizus]|nr:hypothetical protein G6F23_007654 [Rhizopus arrhizus]KAG1410868.1 hypothetical protein G6F58_008872 [Rhizopus delemar]KAG0768721.1 hypothetical protein G6F24_001699 [Rhizopus arrhizus]KAG0779828.1 hypothetical protein G6F22_010420 [Rhizopus arrhizus]KAG0787725.1 hypothetical protein G6F21_007710 [Rhizopus arrhizus]